jgi:hypothetical protein
VIAEGAIDPQILSGYLNSTPRLSLTNAYFEYLPLKCNLKPFLLTEGARAGLKGGGFHLVPDRPRCLPDGANLAFWSLLIGETMRDQAISSSHKSRMTTDYTQGHGVAGPALTFIVKSCLLLYEPLISVHDDGYDRQAHGISNDKDR